MTATAPKYKIAKGKLTQKWKVSAGTGLTVGGAVGIFVAYVAAKVDPTMPPEVLAALIWLTTWLLTQGSMMVAGYVARPDPEDRPVVDPATLPKRPVEPLPPTPPTP